jgi:hypothetical protein
VQIGCQGAEQGCRTRVQNKGAEQGCRNKGAENKGCRDLAHFRSTLYLVVMKFEQRECGSINKSLVCNFLAKKGGVQFSSSFKKADTTIRLNNGQFNT